MTTDGDALLRAILTDPADDAPRLAYADWLEGQSGEVECRHCLPSRPGRRCHRCHGVVGDYYSHHSGEDYDGTWVCDRSDRCPKCHGSGQVPDGRRERAEFIRVQHRLADPHRPRCSCFMHGCGELYGDKEDGCEPHREWARLNRREQSILRAVVPGTTVPTHDALWHLDVMTVMGPDFPKLRPAWERGFIARLELPTAAFTAHAAAIFARHPVTAVRLTDREPFVPFSDGQPDANWYDGAKCTTGVHLASNLPSDVFDLVEGYEFRNATRKQFDGVDKAVAALSAACVRYARRLAGLPDLRPQIGESA